MLLHMKDINFFLIIFFCFISCEKESVNHPFLGEALWMTYALNHESPAVSSSNKKIEIDFVKLSPLNTYIDTLSNDTIEIYFSFYYRDRTDFFRNSLIDCVGIGFVNDMPKYPICKLTPIHPYSDDQYLQYIEEKFILYLKSYQGTIDEKLKELKKQKLDKN